MTAQTLQRRAEIEQAMAGRTICDLLEDTAAGRGTPRLSPTRPATAGRR